MRVAVTGAHGRIGRYCVKELAAAGHHVLGLDLQAATEPGVRCLRVDLTDAGQVYGALAGVEAVVHMGAWANSGAVPDVRTYDDNTTGTFHVFQACADLGIRRIVSASSAQVYGFSSHRPACVPVDEDHPLHPLNSYAASKIAGEQAAQYFSGQHGMEIVSFRIMGARAPVEMRANVERIAGDPAGDKGLLWTRVDARDVATAARLALEAPTVEAGPYNITGRRVVLNRPSCELVREHCGSATEIRDALTGSASPLSCHRAQRVFGYDPQYDWGVDRSHPEH
jgi:nucleoside-diphosphate-sugar epimerase